MNINTDTYININNMNTNTNTSTDTNTICKSYGKLLADGAVEIRRIEPAVSRSSVFSFQTSPIREVTSGMCGYAPGHAWTIMGYSPSAGQPGMSTWP